MFEFELVPSECMRKYYEEIGFTFTDFQKATLIWNAPERKRQEILEALSELAEVTDDERLKKQIDERLHYEEKVFEKYADNADGKYVYVVAEREENENAGFFANYDRALKYAIKYMQEYNVTCCIQKQLIVGTAEDELVRNPLKVNPNMGLSTEEYCEYRGVAVASAGFSMDGEVEGFYSNELPEEESSVDEYKTKRFENSFIKLPFSLHAGCPVKNVVTGAYGILAQGEEDWNKYIRWIEEKNIYVDYSDTQVIVFELNESGVWSHEHINPIFLDVERPLLIPGDEKRLAFLRAMEAMSDYLICKEKARDTDAYVKNMIKCSKAYAQICRDDGWEKRFDEAGGVEDIID